MPDLAPSEIRKIILDGHEDIRKKLAALEILASHFTKGAESENQKLLTLAQELNTLFLAHLHIEEAILRPVLLTIDAWGEVRVERMDFEHKEQRARIADLQKLIGQKNYSVLQKELQLFIEELHEDMSAEEKELLSPEVLRDDVISVNLSSG